MESENKDQPSEPLEKSTLQRRRPPFAAMRSLHRIIFMIILLMVMKESRPTEYHFVNFRDALVDGQVDKGKRFMRKAKKFLGKKLAKTTTTDYYFVTMNTMKDPTSGNTWYFVGAFGGFLPVYMTQK